MRTNLTTMKILLLLAIIAQAAISSQELRTLPSLTATAAAPDYSIVIGRQDKAKIVRFDANNEAFKKLYINIKNPSPRRGTWSMNFKTFIPVNDLPVACQHAWKKKHFWANIATDMFGSCQHWEFNQGHIWRILNTHGNIEETFTFNFAKSNKKFCLQFTSYETGTTPFK